MRRDDNPGYYNSVKHNTTMFNRVKLTWSRQGEVERAKDSQAQIQGNTFCTETFFIHTISTPAMLEVNVSLL